MQFAIYILHQSSLCAPAFYYVRNKQDDAPLLRLSHRKKAKSGTSQEKLARAAHSHAQHTRILTIVINSSQDALLLLKMLSAGRIRRKHPTSTPLTKKFARKQL